MRSEHTCWTDFPLLLGEYINVANVTVVCLLFCLVLYTELQQNAFVSVSESELTFQGPRMQREATVSTPFRLVGRVL